MICRHSAYFKFRKTKLIKFLINNMLITVRYVSYYQYVGLLEAIATKFLGLGTYNHLNCEVT